MSEFLDTFAAARPRENSGSSSSNRFDYQKNWALCELLDLHLNDEDYLMVFEHHEDIVVLNSEDQPTGAIFYQIKSKISGNWTINALVKNKTKEEDSSILGKLFNNQHLFPENVEELVFASNQCMSGTLECGTSATELECIGFQNLKCADKEKIWKACKGDNNVYCDFAALQKIKIVRSDLRLEDYVQLTKGKLVDFFDSLYPDRPVHVALAYKTIFDEIRRRSNSEKSPRSTDELCKNKAISKSEFAMITGLVAQSRTSNEVWMEASQLLSSSSLGPLAQRKIKQEWDKYVVEKMNVANEQLIKIQRCISDFVSDLMEIGKDDSLEHLMDKALQQLKDDCDVAGYSDWYLKAATIYGVINYDSVSTASTKPAGQTK